MIWQSIFLMTVVDVLILGIVGYSAAVFLRSQRRWAAHSSQIGFFAILGGLSLVALFYLADLLVMHAFPRFVPGVDAMAIMRELHLNGSWLVALLGIGTICFGFTSLNRVAAALVGDLEARERDLDRELAERKQAEEALRESRDQIRLIVDNLPVAIGYLDTEMRYRFVNRTIEEWYARPAEKILGHTVWELLGALTSDGTKPTMEAALAGSRQHYEKQASYPDGKTRVVDVIYVPHIDESGTVRGCFALAQDVTERKQAEQALRESEARLKRAQEIAHIGSFVWDEVTDEAIYRSEVIGDIYGLPPEQVPRSFEETLRIIHPDDREWVREAFTAASRAGRAYGAEYRIARPDGEIRYVHELSDPEYDENGTLVRSMGTLQDITERKRAETARRESEALFRALVDNLPVEIAMRDTKGRYLLVNHAWEKVVGRRNEDVIGGTLHDVFAKVEADLYMAQDRAVLATGRVVDEEAEVPREGGVKFLHMIKFPIPDARGDIASIGSIVTDITERKQAEAALRESEARFRTLVEHAPEAITMLDVDTGLYLDANPMAEALHGLPRDELIGKVGPADLSPEIQPDGRPSSEASSDYLGRALAGEFPRFEWMHLAADGQEIPCEVSLARLPDPHRNLVRASISDITERRRAEQALRESEARLSKAAEMAGIGYWVWDEIEDKAVFCSEELAKMYGVASGEELAAIFSSHAADLEWVHPEDRERFDQAVREAKLLKCGVDIEYRIIDSKGNIRHVHVVEEPILDEHGGIIRTNGIAQDITERKRAEEALRQSEQRFKDIANSSADWFWELDENFRFTYLSDRYQQVTGVDPKQVLGKARKEIRENRDLPAEYEAEYRELDSYYRERKPYRDVRYKVLLPDGRVRHWRASGQPLFGEKGEFRGYRGCASDVTDEVRAEEALRENQAQLRQAQKMEALGQLAGGTAHEINNLLQPIITFAKLTRDEVEDPAHRHYLDRVLECGRRAKEIVADILTFARKAPGKPEAIEVRELMTATVRFVRDLIPSTIELRSEISTDTGQALINRTEFTQVIVNLAQNAADAIDRAGTVSVTAKLVDLGGHRAIQRHLSDGRYYRVSVKDTGSGMTEEILKRLFEPFFTTKAAGKGTGLGLSVVYGIVTGWGGSVSADSVVGEGSVFDVYIPLMQESAIPSRGLRHDAHTDR